MHVSSGCNHAAGLRKILAEATFLPAGSPLYRSTRLVYGIIRAPSLGALSQNRGGSIIRVGGLTGLAARLRNIVVHEVDLLIPVDEFLNPDHLDAADIGSSGRFRSRENGLSDSRNDSWSSSRKACKYKPCWFFKTRLSPFSFVSSYQQLRHHWQVLPPRENSSSKLIAYWTLKQAMARRRPGAQV